MSVKIIFYIIATILCLITSVFGVICFVKKKKNYHLIGMILFLSAIIVFSYTYFVATDDYFRMSLFSSIRYSAITMILMYLASYMMYYVSASGKKVGSMRRSFLGAGWLYATFDIIIFMVNPFKEIAIKYSYNISSVVKWNTRGSLFFTFHLVFCYVVLIIIFLMLINKILTTPAVYRSKYISVLLGLLAVVALNSIYPYVGKKYNFDYSIALYPFFSLLIYYNSYYFSGKKMLNAVRQIILDELGRPVILFDESNNLAMFNDVSAFLLPEGVSDSEYTLSQFVLSKGYDIGLITADKDSNFQWNNFGNGKMTSYRVDYHILRDRKNRPMGRVFVYTENSLDMDMLTGFSSTNSFERNFRNGNVEIVYPAAIAICDINNLSRINRDQGNEAGDLAIKSLAKIMRQVCPDGTNFARLQEANLLILASNTEYADIKKYLEDIRTELALVPGFDEPLGMEYAISILENDEQNVLEEVKNATFSMKSKKLMDAESAHSSLLGSLAQTLRESDSTTEEHVQRTKLMGEKLGLRMGLTDMQLSNLALLCLLHDIGKLGIPLEILNKPGKLNDGEWNLMKSHVEKGYSIASASEELSEIADLIRHHHECWNGRGYPDGLVGEEIPLLSRVISIVDAYDAMRNDRPYRKAMTEKEAREELKRCAGTQFDPNIIEEFVALLEEMNPICDAEEIKPEESEINGSVDSISSEKNKDLPLGITEMLGGHAENGNIRTILHARYKLDANNIIISADDDFTKITGYTGEDVKTGNIGQMDLIPEEDREEYVKIASKLLSDNSEAFIEHRLKCKDGNIIRVMCYGRLKYDSVTHSQQTEILATQI